MLKIKLSKISLFTWTWSYLYYEYVEQSLHAGAFGFMKPWLGMVWHQWVLSFRGDCMHACIRKYAHELACVFVCSRLPGISQNEWQGWFLFYCFGCQSIPGVELLSINWHYCCMVIKELQSNYNDLGCASLYTRWFDMILNTWGMKRLMKLF